MNSQGTRRFRHAFIALSAAALFCTSVTARADEREDLEKLRATLLSLIDALTKTGILPRDRADGMMREAEARANARLAQMPPQETGPDGKKIVRVAYVPEAVKTQMRDQIKAEVLAETKGDRAGGMSGFDSAGRFQVEGDIRIRMEQTKLDSGNTPARALSLAESALTRAPDIFGSTGNGLSNFNTQEDANRQRIRARVGVTVAISDMVSAGAAISTGNTTGPTSTNQTIALGAQNPATGGQSPGFFNKYNLAVDRAYIKFEPRPWLSVTGGRFRNPYFGTDLVWADDLNFEGVALSLKPKINPALNGFLTAGWFPLSITNPKQSSSRDLLGFQAGLDWQIGQKENRLKVAGALFDYRRIEGIAESAGTFASLPDYVTRSEYGAQYRQRGNTLFRINAPTAVDAATNWGLASSFREVNFNASLDIAQFDPVHVILTGDYVNNRAFDRDAMRARTGRAINDGSGQGYMGRVQVGMPQISRFGDWNVSLAYRRLGSDAVVDAFTNSDFGLGGTNNKGTIFGASFGVARNTWLTARWLSSDLIDSMIPATAAGGTGSKLSVDTFQLDLNARF